MPGRVRLTAAVTLALSGAFFVYDLGIDQLLGEDRSKLVPHTRPEQPQLELDDAELVARRYLREHPWVEDAEIQLRDGKRLFYFSQSWTETENKREVRFEPLAIVWFSPKQKEPLTIVAESALVTFESDVDLANPEPGRIVGGELTGAVSIKGPKQLRIDGRHFIFSEKAASIWSDDAVSFGYADRQNGKSQTASGTADQGIQIDLDVETAPSSEQPIAVGAVREIHLRRRVEIDFEFEQNGQTIPLAVSCNGRFSLAMTDPMIDPSEPMIATFEDDVLVRRLWPDSEPDTLTSDVLRLFLNRVSPFDKPKSSDSDTLAASPLGSDIELRWMRATGRRVVLRSPKEKLTAVMSRLDYDPASRRIILNDIQSNKVDSQARRQNLIHLPRVDATIGDSRLQCEQIELLHDEDDNIREVLCSGKGLLAHREPDDKDSRGDAENTAPLRTVLTAQWMRQLRISPDPDSDLDIIDFSGGAILRVPDERASVSAEFIKVWIDKLKSLKREKGDSTPLPHRMLAQNGVTLDSPQMSGHTETLQIWFEQAPAETGLSGPDRDVAGKDSTGRVGIASLDGDKSGKKKDEPTEPVKVTSDLIRVRMIRRGQDAEPELAEVWSEGNVEITSRREADVELTVLKGQKLHLRNRAESETGQVIHIYGSPARIIDPSLNLTGNEVFLDRERNLVWVDGEGTLAMPVDRDLDGKLLAIPATLEIGWNEQMAFDGLVATIVGRVSASVLQSSMRCQQMDVTMTDRVLFQRQEKKIRPEIETVVCRYRVEVESHRVEDGTLNEVVRARFAAFAMQQSTGRAEARGPGFVKMWRRGRGKRAALAPTATGKANQGASADSTGWEYTRIDFANEMLGQQDARSMKFLGQVQVVYGPVNEPLETIDLESLPKDGGAMYCDLLDFTQRQFTTAGKKDQTVELLAQGNARLEGQSFFAQAYEISFDETKGLYTLRSQGDQQAMLWRQARPGGKRTPVVAKTFRFIPSQNYVDFDNASLVQGIQ
jgi:hypothetical protein